jgi:hypothetical protein
MAFGNLTGSGKKLHLYWGYSKHLLPFSSDSRTLSSSSFSIEQIAKKIAIPVIHLN